MKYLLLFFIVTIGSAIGHVLGTILLAVFQMTYGMDFMNWLLDLIGRYSS